MIPHSPTPYVTCSQLEAFKRAQFREFITQLLLCLPKGARHLTLYNLSWIMVTIKARLSFTTNVETDKAEYGRLDEACYPIGKYEEVRASRDRAREIRVPRAGISSRSVSPVPLSAMRPPGHGQLHPAGDPG